MAASLQDQLAAAQLAYGNLLTGASPRVVVDQNGERVEYVAASAPRLYAYIQTLISQINAAANGSCIPTVQVPLQFTF